MWEKPDGRPLDYRNDGSLLEFQPLLRGERTASLMVRLANTRVPDSYMIVNS